MMNYKYHSAVILVIFSVVAGCNSSAQQKAEEHTAKTDKSTPPSSAKEIALPGMKRESMPEGCYLRAVIDGKKWEATEMTPDRSHPSIVPVNGKNDQGSITFVISGMRENVGKPSNLSESNHITYWDGAGLILGAQSGQVTVQKVDDQFIEGTFNFDAEKDGKKVICTDGQFRIPAPLPAK